MVSRGRVSRSLVDDWAARSEGGAHFPCVDTSRRGPATTISQPDVYEALQRRPDTLFIQDWASTDCELMEGSLRACYLDNPSAEVRTRS